MAQSDYGIFVLTYEHDGTVINRWLLTFDPEAREGMGFATFTKDFAEALHFKNIEAATMFWRTQSVTRPLRADGHANRPLTAFTVEIARPRETAQTGPGTP